MRVFSCSRHHLRNGHLLSFQCISTLNSRPSTSKRRLISVGRRAHEMDGQRKDHNRSPQLGSDSKVSKLQQTLESSYDADGWEKCWKQGLTPWDLGGPTPVILDLLKTGALPKGRALIPGCGSGHDVVALAGPERYVVGVDISDNAIQKAIELSSSLPNVNCFNFMKANIFTWNPAELFDLIFDYTFFCAIEPSLRPAWANKIRDLLKPDGELITLMFPVSDHIGGPPYKVSVANYEEVLHPVGFRAVSVIDNNLAVKPRKGREKLGRWKRRLLTESCL